MLKFVGGVTVLIIVGIAVGGTIIISKIAKIFSNDNKIKEAIDNLMAKIDEVFDEIKARQAKSKDTDNTEAI